MRKTIRNRALGATLGVVTIASLSLTGAMTTAQAAPAKETAKAAAAGDVSSAATLSKAAKAAG